MSHHVTQRGNYQYDVLVADEDRQTRRTDSRGTTFLYMVTVPNCITTTHGKFTDDLLE